MPKSGRKITPAEAEETLVWAPQPRQHAFISCPFEDVLFGGARGGGKTDAVIGDWITHQHEFGRHVNGIVIRRSMTELEDMIRRALEILPQIGAVWHDQKRRFVMPNGSMIRFRYLEREQDAMAYQGHAYTRVYFEELGNFATSRPIDLMYATLRNAYGIPCGMRATANPGGPGHSWVKARYITPAPLGFHPIEIMLPSGKVFTRCFIPSRLEDNLALMRNDPGYEDRLYLVGSAALVKAWREGDWDAVEGAYFDGWSGDLVIPPFPIPASWTRFRSFDWGYAKPFSVGWWAVASGEPVDTEYGPLIFPRGSLIRYREFYGCKPGAVNEGLRMEVEEIADNILKLERGDQIDYGVADPAIFESSRGPSIASRFAAYRPDWDKSTSPVIWRRGENKRLPGWSQVRQRMLPDGDGKPMLYVFSTCVDSIRLIPSMQHDKNKPEDLDTESEDHVADEWRYGCMSRPMPKMIPAKRQFGPHPRSMDALAPVVLPKVEGSRYTV